MFYFQGLLSQALAGIDATSILTTVIGIAYAILVIGFLISLYQAAMRGGDLQALAAAGVKYLVVAAILANWSSVFREVNTSFNQVANFIGQSSGAGDMFMSWLQQLQQDFPNHPGVTLMNAITGDYSSGITLLLIVISYVAYVLATIVFGFFYAFYGCLLYTLGPLVLALLPLGAAGDLAKSYAMNVMIWNAWSLIYALLGALITAVHANHYDAVLSNGFIGFLQGSANSIVLGIVSLFYALLIALIPFIAKRLISGDVGATAMALVKAGAAVVGTAVSAGAGFAAGGGFGALSAGGGGGGAGTVAGGASSGSATIAQAGGQGASSTAASSTPPPQTNLADSIARKMQKGEQGSESGGSSEGSGGSGKGASQGGGNYPASQAMPYRPQGLAQTVAYHAGRMTGEALSSKAQAKEAAKGAESKENKA